MRWKKKQVKEKTGKSSETEGKKSKRNREKLKISNRKKVSHGVKFPLFLDVCANTLLLILPGTLFRCAVASL